MMSLRLAPPLPLLFLLMVSEVVVSQPGWGVDYRPNFICAVKGSTVTMGCSYKYPRVYTVRDVFWSREFVTTDKEPTDMSTDPNYRDRIQYLGDKSNICTLSLSRVREDDQGKYYFRFITNVIGGKYQGRDGVDLSVTDLQVEISPDRVVEGKSVTLTCKTTCSLTGTTKFIWYKNGGSLSTVSSSNPLRLTPVTQSDAGSYSCAVEGQSFHSSVVRLDVEYPPRSVSVSISPSAEIMEGSSVTLTCSSDASPPAETYTWYKGTIYKRTGHTYTIYRISSEDSGDYKCKAMNQHGTKYSFQTTVNVLYPPKNVSVSISPSGQIEEGRSVTLTCSSDANPPVHDYTWYKVNESSPVGSGQSYSFTMSFSSSGWFYCEAQNKYGSQRAAAVSLTVNGGSNVVLYAVLGVVAVCSCLFAIVGVLFIRRKRKGGSAEDVMSSQENTYSSVSAATSNPAPSPDLVNQDDVQYASIQHQNVSRRAESSPVQAAGSEAAEEVQYATVQHRHDTVTEKNREDEDQYANVRFNVTGAAYRSK